MYESDIVFIEQNSLQSLIVYEVYEINTLVRKTSVGQFVKSSTFELDFPTSIGKSKWNIMLFLNGQYDHKGIKDNRIFVYLKMTHCEKQSSVFKLDAKFQLGSEFAKKQDQTICFVNARSTWIGTYFRNINEMIIQDNTLLLSVYLNERFYDKTGSERFYDKTGSKVEFIILPQNSYNRSGSSKLSYQVVNKKIPIHDGNLNGKSNLKSLLKSWDLNELYPKFEEYGYTYRTLMFAKEKDLIEIFYDEKKLKGPLTIFLGLLEELKKNSTSFNTALTAASTSTYNLHQNADDYVEIVDVPQNATSAFKSNLNENDDLGCTDLAIRSIPSFTLSQNVEIVELPSLSASNEITDDVEIVELPSLSASNEITDDVEIVELPSLSASNEVLTAQTLLLPLTSNKLSDFNLNTFLRSTPEGLGIIKFYEEKRKFFPRQQRLLVRLIIDHLFSIQNRWPRSCIEMIAGQISMLFLSEKSTTYFKTEIKNGKIVASGILYRAYNNRVAKLGRLTKGKRKLSVELAVSDDESFKSPSINDSTGMQYMNDNYMNDNDETLLQHWHNCFEYRSAKMKQYENFEELFNDWKLLTILNGFSLVNIDFQRKYAASVNVLQTGWSNFFYEKLSLIDEALINPEAKQSIATLCLENGDKSNVVIAFALHHLLIPSSIGWGEKRWRPSVKSSKDTMLKIVASKSAIVKKLEFRKTQRNLRSIEDHPIIYGVGGGDIEDIEEYIVAMGNILLRTLLTH